MLALRGAINTSLAKALSASPNSLPAVLANNMAMVLSRHQSTVPSTGATETKEQSGNRIND